MLLCILSSCSVVKYVPADKYLVNRVKVESDIDGITKSVVKPYLSQNTNTGIFGRWRVQLQIYSLSGQDTSKWINRKLREIGEAPVIYSSELTNLSRLNIERLMKNKGYSNAVVEVDTTFKKKRATIVYKITGNEPYFIRSIKYETNLSELQPFVDADTSHISVKVGDLFDADKLEEERQRMVKVLRNQGFYYFNKDHIYVEADTALNNHQVDLVFKFNPMTKVGENGEVKTVPHQRMKIRNVGYLPWYDNTLSLKEQAQDSLICGKTTYYDSGKRNLCPKTVYMKTHIVPGKYFSEQMVERTYSNLNTLSVTRYVTINFTEVNDSLLDCYIALTPVKVQTFTIEVEGNNTEGDIGAAVNGTYTHRNVFKRSNQFSLKLRAAYQPMGYLEDFLSDKSIDVGGEASLRFPRALIPFLNEKTRKRIRAITEVAISYNFQTNPWYTRNTAGIGMKYVWTAGRRNERRYSVNLVDLSYVYLPVVSETFRNTYLNTSSLSRFSYEDHFIMSAGFTFSKSTQNRSKERQSFYTYRGSIETAGNLLQGICAAANAPKKDGSYTILNIRFAQYVKGEFDFAYNHVINSKNRLVYHFNVGLAYPYGNETVVPFEKRFYAGGANSVRGWSVRSLGPGGYVTNSKRKDFNQTGDIKLDLNIEYRFKLFWVLEGAAFLDAGNIWTIREYETQKGGVFKFDEFYKQIAFSYGLGLRFDFDFFILRCDLGAQLYDPTKKGREQWRNLEWDNMAFHLAIGYPF